MSTFTLMSLGYDALWHGQAVAAAYADNLDLHELAIARVSTIHRTRFEAIGAPFPDAPDSAVPLRTFSVTLSTAPHDDETESLPVVGDWVLLDAHPDHTVLLAILPRRTYLDRPSATRISTAQPVAANVDALCIVEPVFPEPSVGRIERYVALARSSMCEAVLVLTKTDLCSADAFEDYRSSLGRDVDAVHAVSVDSPASIADFYASLTGKTAVLLGRSGAGKSTLVNTMLGDTYLSGAPGTIPQVVSGVRASDGKGRHTTTSRHMLVGKHAVVIDTPGVRALAATTDPHAIDETFTDISVLAAKCRYTDCAHRSEPGCAVREALGSGLLDAERFDRYQRMRRESENQRLRADERAYREQNRRFTKANKSGRRTLMRVKGRSR